MARKKRKEKEEENEDEVVVAVNGDKGDSEGDQPPAKRVKVDNDNGEDKAVIVSDLYLETVNRSMLDFDFEKLCSVSLSNLNVYACLVCGKYFQGRGTTSHAYFHALHEGHHVYLNLGTLKVYVLPESYEVHHKSLDDIKFVVDPKFTQQEVMRQLDKMPRVAYDLQGRKYIPGFVGLNNIRQNDYFNVIIQALAHTTPLRNFFLLESSLKGSGASELVSRTAILMRKMWSGKSFKSHVSPHELLQQVNISSSKKYSLTTQSDPVEFISWFLNALHKDLGGTHVPGSSIIHKVFQGTVRVRTQQISSSEGVDNRTHFRSHHEITTKNTPFLMLTLDLPPPPLFQDEVARNIIPQVDLMQLLNKYDGKTRLELAGQRKIFTITQLPPVLIFHIKRFVKSSLGETEKNPTIVTYPTTSLDMRNCKKLFITNGHWD